MNVNNIKIESNGGIMSAEAVAVALAKSGLVAGTALVDVNGHKIEIHPKPVDYFDLITRKTYSY